MLLGNSLLELTLLERAWWKHSRRDHYTPAHKHTHICTQTQAHMHTSTGKRSLTDADTYTHACMHALCTHIQARTHADTMTHLKYHLITLFSTLSTSYDGTHACARTHTCTYMRIHVRTYTCTYTHTQICTYTHRYAQKTFN